VGELPGGAVAEEFLDEGGVHGMAGAFGNDATPDAAACEGQVADEVEDFVADELIREAEGAVEDTVSGEDDGGGVGDAADEAHVAKHGFIFLKAEGAGGSNEVGVGSGFEVAGEVVATDGCWKVDGVVDGVARAGVDAYEFVSVGRAFADLDGLEDADVLALAALTLEAVGEDGGDVGERAAVEDGDLEVVDLDDDVVDAEADESGEQMLGGLDKDALAHEGGGVADACDVAAGGGDFKVVEIGAAEDDAGAGGCGDKAHGYSDAGVQANALEVQWTVDRVFELGMIGQARTHTRLTESRLYPL
jgi:hypothetical protein